MDFVEVALLIECVHENTMYDSIDTYIVQGKKTLSVEEDRTHYQSTALIAT